MNLSSKEIQNWGKNINSDLAALYKALTPLTTNANELAKICKSADTTLYQRFIDLGKQTDTAYKKLNEFNKVLESNLNTYVKAVQSAETKQVNSQKAAIDQFAENANLISKITM